MHMLRRAAVSPPALGSRSPGCLNPFSARPQIACVHTTTAARRRAGVSRTLPGTVTHTVTPLRGHGAMGGQSGNGGAGGRGPFERRTAEEMAALPALRCPGGPRIKAEGIKHLYKVPHAGFLAKYDQRFMLNLKLTHQIASHLSRSTLKTSDKVLLELGPGAGSLTRSLLTRPCVGVLGVESDERFNAHLEQIRSYTRGKFQWVNADVLEMNEVALLSKYFPDFVRLHQRHRPGGSSGSRKARHADSHEGADGQPEDDVGDDDVSGEEGAVDGAPLRSAAREELLRRRRTHFTSGSGRSAGEGPSAASSSPFYKHSYEGGPSRHPQWGDSARAARDVTDRWWSDGDSKVEVVANLPFSVITELLMRYAVDCSRRTNLFSFGRVPLHIFTQKEVADRILAAAGSIHFSRLSVLAQAFFRIKVQQVFTEWTYYPKTEVLGAMLTLEPRVVPLGWTADSLGGPDSARSSSSSGNKRAAHPRPDAPVATAVVDGAALIHFTDLIMKAGHRGAAVHKALSAFMPPEVVQYVLQASRMDGAMTVLDLSVEEIVRMAGMWRAFLAASQQHGPQL